MLEVVTYDSVARRGFMRVVEPPAQGRVVFHLSYLPREVRSVLVERSRPLNAKGLPPDLRRQLKAGVRAALVGQRFRALLERRGDARWRLVVRSLTAAATGDVCPCGAVEQSGPDRVS